MLICEISKNQKEKIRVSIEEFRGATFADVRVFWQDEQGSWKPSRKGISLGGNCINEVIEALQKASAKLEGG